MGLLWADENADLTAEASWNKRKEPVFISSERNEQFGPGHNSFTKSEDGKSDLLIYHARPERNNTGDPLNNPNRHTNVQVFTWDKAGFPVFGEPVASTKPIKKNSEKSSLP